MTPTIAYLAEGKLYLSVPDKGTRQVESQFAQEMLDRQERSRQRNDWKSDGMAWQFSRMQLGTRPQDPHVRQIRLTGLARGRCTSPEGLELYYAMQNGAVGGLFVWTAADNYERRLLHRNGFVARDVVRHPDDGTLAVSIAAEDGSANLAILSAEGKGLKQITEGDSVDEAPAWAPGESKVLVYQSAGVGRNAAGMPLGVGPYAIMRLDLDRGEMSTLLEAEHQDHLSPRVAADGSMYFIRRPYQPPGQVEVSPIKAVKDFVLFPFRTAAAIVHFLNWFSVVFTRNPLLTAGGPPREGPDARYMMLWGKLVDAEKALNDARKGKDVSLVPKSWELVRRDASPAGAGEEDEQVIARGVLSFDLCPDGGIVYTNGVSVYHADGRGADAKKIGTGRMIERVISLV